ncbi:decaprenyl-phosphate phosphoribosyltransferase [Sorangium sp. So ce1036]|uniref:decaprenyl-phosphate phosphoribosyltransferase n=1 Tax=Sorangium sp. So ce1036 TaxID=3133328 RepID=UPI003F08FBE2
MHPTSPHSQTNLDPGARAGTLAVGPRPGAAVALLRAMRPRQWTKNLLLFGGFLFTVNERWTPFTESMWTHLGRAAGGFLLFCGLSSAVYLLNDLKDIERDRLHPVKRNRPLASGALPPRLAQRAVVLLTLVTAVLGYALSPLFAALCACYFLMQLLYTFALKEMVILDVLVIALGFVLRAVGGAVVLGVDISPWLYTVTLLGALFLGLAKRRHELVVLGDAAQHRPILKEYTRGMLDQLIGIVTAGTIMAYSLYTFTAANLPANHLMMLTIPFVIYGVFRYLYLIHLRQEGGSPEEVLLHDRPLIGAILLWASSAGVILAFFR